MARTPREIIEQEIPQRLGERPGLQGEIDAVIALDVIGEAGGHWTLDLTRVSGWVRQGAGASPRMTLTVEAHDFVAVWDRELDAQLATAMGKFKFKPMDVDLALRLGKLLG